jgi:hypothetical protein
MATIKAKDGKILARECGGIITTSCCDCTPKNLSSYTTNSAHPNWMMSAFIGDNCDGVAKCGRWRIIEITVAGDHNPYCTIYATGVINENRRLVGLAEYLLAQSGVPGRFHSNYSYDGHMRLQQGCWDLRCEDWGYGYKVPHWFIKWPDSGECPDEDDMGYWW